LLASLPDGEVLREVRLNTNARVQLCGHPAPFGMMPPYEERAAHGVCDWLIETFGQSDGAEPGAPLLVKTWRGYMDSESRKMQAHLVETRREL
ncbi:MAG: hypothetical protein WAT39_00110, partial [Planctomycetota bacterium]